MSQGPGEIRLVARGDISDAKWDVLVSESNHIIFMSRWYLDEVMPDWTAIVLNDYEACLPIQISKKYHLDYALQPLFIRAFSVLGDNQKAQLLLKKLQEETSFFSVALDIDVNDKHFMQEHSINQLLPLNKDYELIYKKYSQNRGVHYTEVSARPGSTVIYIYCIYIHCPFANVLIKSIKK